MELINAREAATITGKARAEAAQYRVSLAECCVKDDIMPCIRDAAEDGRSHVVINIAQNHDAYRVRDLIITMLCELGYMAKLEREGKEIVLKW